MPDLDTTSLADLVADGVSPQEVLRRMSILTDQRKLADSSAQFPTALLPQEDIEAIAQAWLLPFAEFLDGPEQSPDYATAAAIARDAISDIAANGISGERLITLVRAIGLVYRRVMIATPHLRQQQNNG